MRRSKNNLINSILAVAVIVLLAVVIYLIYNDYSEKSKITREIDRVGEIKYQDELVDDYIDEKVENPKVDLDKEDSENDSKVVNVEVKDEKNSEKVEVKDSDSDETDKIVDEETKKESGDEGDKKIYKGILEKADDNSYDANYMLIGADDTGYTYFWFDGDMSEVEGKLVEIEVMYDKDGNFTVISGPSPVNQ